ncbi:MAG TPA: hypothetical protein PK467_16445, partial [Candidatus Wallbacteria bacterium]|nr:hypothetical protein [Candidatus Wallbacteria bacterium]
VLYSDSSSEFKTTVLYFDGTKWSALGARDFSEPNASFLSLAAAGDSVFIAYTNWMFGNLPQIMKFTPQDGWTKFSSLKLWNKPFYFNNLAVDGGVLYFLTRDNREAGFMLYKFVNNEWLALTDSPMAKVCEMLKLRVYNGVPYVSYANSDSGLLYLMKYENNEWKKIGKSAISDGRAMFSDFVVDGIKPYVIFIDGAVGNRVVVSSFANEEWSPVGEKGISGGMAGYCAIDCYNNEPYISFRDVTAGEKIKVLKFEY